MRRNVPRSTWVSVLKVRALLPAARRRAAREYSRRAAPAGWQQGSRMAGIFPNYHWQIKPAGQRIARSRRLQSAVTMVLNSTTTGVLNTCAWHALVVRHNAEKTVKATLDSRGYLSYLPLYRRQSRWSDRLKVMDAILFPGYVFCRIATGHHYTIAALPGVVDVLRFGAEYAIIPDREIEAVQQVIRSSAGAMPWPYLKEGDNVRVTKGPLTGVEGILCRVKSDFRIIVSVPILQRAVAVHIDRDHVEPIRS